MLISSFQQLHGYIYATVCQSIRPSATVVRIINSFLSLFASTGSMS